MYQVTYSLPQNKHAKSNLLKMDAQEALLYQIIQENFFGFPTLKTANLVTIIKKTTLRQLFPLFSLR